MSVEPLDPLGPLRAVQSLNAGKGLMPVPARWRCVKECRGRNLNGTMPRPAGDAQNQQIHRLRALHALPAVLQPRFHGCCHAGMVAWARVGVAVVRQGDARYLGIDQFDQTPAIDAIAVTAFVGVG